MTEYENRIKSVLGGIVHPETGEDIVSSGIVEHITANGQDAVITLAFRKRRDPFANSIKRQVTAAVTGAFPELAGKIAVTEKEEAPAPPVKEKVSSTAGIRHILAIASGKGGVGKSTVTANLAVTLRDMGYSVGILDADIYGPSMPKMFGVEGYTPQAILRDEQEYILPAETGGIKIASIGFFISPDDALIWRGPMATTALKQLLHQTLWEGLDYLLIDLPPGTGDVHLSVVGEVKVNGAIVVGFKLAGLPGTLVAILGTIIPPFVIISLISAFYHAFRDNYLVSQMLEGMQAGVGAVIASVTYEMGTGVVKEKDPFSLVILVCAFAAACFFKVNVIYIVLVCGAIGAVRTILAKRRGAK